MTDFLEDLLTVAEAGVELAPYLNGRDPTHFLADNRCGRTREPTIPYIKKGNRVFYRPLVLQAFAREYLCNGRASRLAMSVARMETDDCPLVLWRKAPEPVLQIGALPPLTLSFEAAKEFAREVAAAVQAMEAAA